jgi:hypothetical protein
MSRYYKFHNYNLFILRKTIRELIAFQVYHNNSPSLICQGAGGDCRKIAVLSHQIEYSIATSAQSDYYLQIKPDGNVKSLNDFIHKFLDVQNVAN